MRKTFKFRLFPTGGQRTKLRRTLEGCRKAYNLCLETRRDAYTNEGRTLTLYDTNGLIKRWRADDPDIAFVHYHCLHQVNERIQLAFQAFWRRCKAGENPGYPRFKGEDRYDSFTFTDPNRGFKLIGDRTLRIHNIGDVRIKKHRPLEGMVKRLTISRDGTGVWFACFSVEVGEKILEPNADAIGIDVGISSFAVLSDGTRVENPRFLKRDDKRLRKVQRQLSESPMGSERRAKKRRAFQKVWKRVENRRKDFAHKLSRSIVDAFGIICVEELNIKGMTEDNRRSLNRNIHDVAWRRFRDLLAYKAEEAGRVLIVVNPKYTSRMCSGCGEMVLKPLDQRVHSCPHCGLEMDRDLNAAINILRRGLASLPEVAGPKAH